MTATTALVPLEKSSIRSSSWASLYTIGAYCCSGFGFGFGCYMQISQQPRNETNINGNCKNKVRIVDRSVILIQLELLPPRQQHQQHHQQQLFHSQSETASHSKTKTKTKKITKGIGAKRWPAAFASGTFCCRCGVCSCGRASPWSAWPSGTGTCFADSGSYLITQRKTKNEKQQSKNISTQQQQGEPWDTVLVVYEKSSDKG